jgi:predicted lactoylglutathione lyase
MEITSFGSRKAGQIRTPSMSGLAAESQAAVNAFYHAALAAGGREKVPPGPQLQYHADYYATWVLDPDGHDIEVVNKTGRVK